jgi:hypothetical protein
MSQRETAEQLRARMDRARRLVPPFSVMRHRKSGEHYAVVGHHLRENDLTAEVAYVPWTNLLTSSDPLCIVFTRPVDALRARFEPLDGEWPAETEGETA